MKEIKCIVFLIQISLSVFANANAQTDIVIEKLTNGQDADTPPGPVITVGDQVLWTYVVTNTGSQLLTNSFVTDDRGLTVTCPKTSLAPGESMTCTANGTAQAGQYANVGTVSAQLPAGTPVSDSDPSHYFGELAPAVAIEKQTNGQDADTPPGPVIMVGDPVIWTYVVVNTGSSSLTNIAVTDDQGLAVACPKNSLAPDESMTCTAAGPAQLGQYANVGTVSVQLPAGTPVSDSDPSHYFGELAPAVAIEKLTNGQDADSPPGPTLSAGAVVTWQYLVTNVSSEPLSAIAVTDDQGVTVACPTTTLAPGESMTCSANGTAQLGQYANIGTVTAQPPAGVPVSDSDPSHYFGSSPSLSLVKSINSGSPYAAVGDSVSYGYEVTNTGNVPLAGPVTVDDDKTSVACPGLNTVGNRDGNLDVGETVICTASYSIVQSDIDAGAVTNTAGASADGTISSPDSATANALQNAGLAVTKTQTSGENPVKNPGALGYEIELANTGNVTLTDIVILDTLPDNTPGTVNGPLFDAGGIGVLDVGETWAFTSSYPVTRADIKARKDLVNSATVTCKQIAGAISAEEITPIYSFRWWLFHEAITKDPPRQ